MTGGSQLEPVRGWRAGGEKTRRPAGELDPEWIMVGVDVPAGKRLYASKDLKGSRFQVAMDEHGLSADGWYLTSTLQRMLIITKPTYGECMADALRIWKNWEDDQRGIAPAGGTGTTSRVQAALERGAAM